MTERLYDAEAAHTRKMVGWCLMGVAGFALLHSFVWIFMRSWGSYWQEVFVGAEGMVVTSVLLCALGVHLVRTPSGP